MNNDHNNINSNHKTEIQKTKDPNIRSLQADYFYLVTKTHNFGERAQRCA